MKINLGSLLCKNKKERVVLPVVEGDCVDV